jgi:predicted RNase H-like nuclease
VFAVPCREALEAETLEIAKRTNLAKIRRSLTAQTWAICPKIAEVDLFLRSELGKRALIREGHPEVCFWAVAKLRQKVSLSLRRCEPAVSNLLDDVLSATRRSRTMFWMPPSRL